MEVRKGLSSRVPFEAYICPSAGHRPLGTTRGPNADWELHTNNIRIGNAEKMILFNFHFSSKAGFFKMLSFTVKLKCNFALEFGNNAKVPVGVRTYDPLLNSSQVKPLGYQDLPVDITCIAASQFTEIHLIIRIAYIQDVLISNGVRSYTTLAFTKFESNATILGRIAYSTF